MRVKRKKRGSCHARREDYFCVVHDGVLYTDLDKRYSNSMAARITGAHTISYGEWGRVRYGSIDGIIGFYINNKIHLIYDLHDITMMEYRGVFVSWP